MLLAGFIRKQRESRQVYDRNPYKKNSLDVFALLRI